MPQQVLPTPQGSAGALVQFEDNWRRRRPCKASLPTQARAQGGRAGEEERMARHLAPAALTGALKIAAARDRCACTPSYPELPRTANWRNNNFSQTLPRSNVTANTS
jgi:hypothetical protein